MKNANSIFTRTNRVVIRQFDQQDIEAFYQYRSNPLLPHFNPGKTTRTKTQNHLYNTNDATT